MSIYLPCRVVGGSLAIAICGRCGMKKYRGDLKKDPNNGLRVCGNCVDQLDPYRLPARHVENVTVRGPMPDEELV